MIISFPNAHCHMLGYMKHIGIMFYWCVSLLNNHWEHTELEIVQGPVRFQLAFG